MDVFRSTLSTGEKMKTVNLINKHNIENNELKVEVLNGLCDSPKHLSSKFFYDEEGSKIFQNIMNSNDYYLTDAETEAFNINKEEIIKALPSQVTLIELGAGDGIKTDILIESLTSSNKIKEYIPIDISPGAITQISETFHNRYPDLKMTGLNADYIDGLEWSKANIKGPKVIFFLGSNIGNFNTSQAQTFLRTVWNNLEHGDFLFIGFDLKKDFEILNKAYNDDQGHTRNFNLNILRRINNEIKADFDLSKFKHYGFYNPSKGCMESYLISTQEQTVHIKELEKKIHFNANEPIHLEYSFKYSEQEIENLAKSTGFINTKNFTDSKGLFLDSLWSVCKSTDN